MNTEQLLRGRIEGSLGAVGWVRDHVAEIAATADLIVERLRSGGTLYSAGNGGSAAQAMHLAEELIGRYRGNRKPVAAMCLNADPTALTCIANDFGFEQVFARQCEALVRPQDVLVVFSTSGKSANIVNGLKMAKARGAFTVGLLGKDGGVCKPLCDRALVVATNPHDSAFIQEAHQVMLHLICEAAEVAFTK